VSADRQRHLRLYQTHTGERIDTAYRRDEGYVPEALASLDQFLRDHRTGEVYHFDPRLFDLLRFNRLYRAAGHRNEFVDFVPRGATNISAITLPASPRTVCTCRRTLLIFACPEPRLSNSVKRLEGLVEAA